MSSPKSVATVCLLCESSGHKELYLSHNPFMRIVRCISCGLMYQNPRVPESEMEDAYEELEEYSHYSEHTGAQKAVLRARIERFKADSSLPESGAFLDVGAAFGPMLDCVRDLLPGWQVMAVEPSRMARTDLLKRGYATFADISEVPADLKFDWINLDNVLEHLPNPATALVEIRKLLKPNGFVYIEVPNESMMRIRYRINDWARGVRKLPTFLGHMTLFTPRTLQKMTNGAGYSSVKVWLESVSMPNRFAARFGVLGSAKLRLILGFLRATRLDNFLRISYFLCAKIHV